MTTLSPNRKATVMSWIGQILVAAILLQVVFFKFTGAAESIGLFEQLGAEPWGRIGTGLVELVAAGLILRSRTAALGAVLSVGLMVGAIGTHLTVLGIEVGGDGGALFTMALITFAAATVVAWIRRHNLPVLGRALAARAVSPHVD